MAYAAKLGGARGIRANSVLDINEIKKAVDLPVIGIIKAEYAGSPVYITPTMVEVDTLVACGADIIAMDATNRLRPGGISLTEFFATVRAKYPTQLFMADCATIDEGLAAAKLGFDAIGTTLSGYTEDSKNEPTPNLRMMAVLAYICGKPVIAEGNISTPQELRLAMECGVYAAVVGSAITRPMLITQRFVEEMERFDNTQMYRRYK